MNEDNEIHQRQHDDGSSGEWSDLPGESFYEEDTVDALNESNISFVSEVTEDEFEREKKERTVQHLSELFDEINSNPDLVKNVKTPIPGYERHQKALNKNSPAKVIGGFFAILILFFSLVSLATYSIPRGMAYLDAHSSATYGFKNRVATFVHQNNNVDLVDSRTGKTLLHVAAANGHSSLVRWLLENQADVTMQDNQGNTPLHLVDGFAAAREMMRYIEKHAMFDALFTINNNNETAIHTIHSEGVAEVLLQSREGLLDIGTGTDDDKLPLVRVLERMVAGQEDITKLYPVATVMLQRMGSKSMSSSSGSRAFNLLVQIEVRQSHSLLRWPLHPKQSIVDLLRLLLDKILVVDPLGGDSTTFLHIAAQKGLVRFAQLLLQKEPRLLNEADDQLRTPLFFAKTGEMAEFLLDRGATPSSMDKQGLTPTGYHLFYFNRDYSPGVLQVLKNYKNGYNCALAYGNISGIRMDITPSPINSKIMEQLASFGIENNHVPHLHTLKSFERDEISSNELTITKANIKAVKSKMDSVYIVSVPTVSLANHTTNYVLTVSIESPKDSLRVIIGKNQLPSFHDSDMDTDSLWWRPFKENPSLKVSGRLNHFDESTDSIDTLSGHWFIGIVGDNWYPSSSSYTITASLLKKEENTPSRFYFGWNLWSSAKVLLFVVLISFVAFLYTSAETIKNTLMGRHPVKTGNTTRRQSTRLSRRSSRRSSFAPYKPKEE
eukprot:gb/GECH01014875.1/.p1 GENE.gb/GECH01014875.1/~~gb/GECH01014875.1/.p1  ORF type:complete len:721 (+),score=143.83 gb/GECH01014875.1/:1-2163(+)